MGGDSNGNWGRFIVTTGLAPKQLRLWARWASEDTHWGYNRIYVYQEFFDGSAWYDGGQITRNLYGTTFTELVFDLSLPAGVQTRLTIVPFRIGIIDDVQLRVAE